MAPLHHENATGRETILALATGPVRSAVAILRLSGPASRFALETIARGCPAPRRASLRYLRAPATEEILDRGLVFWFPEPASFTGEDMAEFHVHGGTAVIRAVISALLAIPGCRLAEPGEFSRRAFLAGRLDLSEAEGIADLVEAQTELQRRQAQRQMDGALSVVILDWRNRLADCLAEVEADLDFSDEADVPDRLAEAVAPRIMAVRDEIAAAIADGRRGERLREGFTVVIAGAPNSGKSTLFNRLLQREAAIVTPIPGTTRDILETALDIDGLPVMLIDTAGLRVTDDAVEKEGIRRALVRAQRADLVLSLQAFDSAPQAADWQTPTLQIWTKSDVEDAPQGFSGLVISSTKDRGIAELLDEVAERAREALGNGSALVTRERHRDALTRALAALQRGLEPHKPTELLAEDLRLALRDLGRVTGHVGVEEILDRIFSSFCIGK
ncbi:MAG: tRNA uridine-5-carboxymethylaminomethyl(34) synthesis GTPase MnmE [Chelatococcus sp.]|nr:MULTISPECIES: tRNA uridine-5-carboxymethylaminomethyl(34) synthesis GTPase MnmE [unclassified Chelatococcus]MBS7696937.1 tRNA uridine-5-carboxymethylaminomethyl(34) synthesis GTPase MnmE [Chelatococcus sp. YT9]MBX3555927.1 tRNA uridine-5-carboxymethylaminomethyl(34) synthesis GTPase MnmE [Chelatococcus sp.]